MNKDELINFKDFIIGTLSNKDISWLIDELENYLTEKEFLNLNPKDELIKRAMTGHRQIENGECYTNEEVMAMLGMEEYELETA